ncbi:unnamed protein product, partial [Rotaria sp. Silwood1]
SDYLIECLSSNLGKKLFSLQCNSITDECQIINYFIGLCQGNNVLFNSINKLNNKCINLYLKLCSILYETILKKS